jgi:Fur family transcriptional regulator, peroxide stress response regulator
LRLFALPRREPRPTPPPMRSGPSPEIAAPEAALRDALEANGQRFTEQRAAVYRFLHSTDGHPTADEVFTAVRGQIADISLATVYKALETLVSCGLAKKLPYGDDSSRYDARMDEHYHARCLACGKVRDVGGDAVPRSLSTIEPADGFRVEGYHLEVVGYCAGCISPEPLVAR